MTFKIQPKPVLSASYEQFEVRAEEGGRYTIDVSLPPGYVAGGAPLPIILATDGNYLFDLTRQLVHGGHARMVGVLPPSIVVGVGYPTDEGMASFYARRTCDFYDEWDMRDQIGQRLQGLFGKMKAAEGKPALVMRAGGFPRFIRFLRDELLPTLADHYPIDPKGRHTLLGDSSGGSFVLRAMYEPNSPFSRYVSISPPLGCASGTIQKAEAAFAAKEEDLDADLFICCGQQELNDQTNAFAGIVSGITWAAEQFAIRNWPSARIEWEIMNNEDHASIAPRAIAAGLRSVHRLRPGVHAEELKKANATMSEEFSRSRRQTGG
jgi:uncharacterized protein